MLVLNTIAVWYSKTSQLMPTPSLGPPSSQGRPGVCVTDAPWFGDSPWFQGHCRNPKVVLQEMVGESEACPSTPMNSRVFFWVFRPQMEILQELDGFSPSKRHSPNYRWTNKVSSTLRCAKPYSRDWHRIWLISVRNALWPRGVF